MNLSVFAESAIEHLPIRPNTRKNYFGTYRRHIAPALGATPLECVQPQHIRELLSPLPPQTAYQTLMVLKSIYREAQRDGLIAASPTDGVRSPRIIVQPRRFLRWEEVEALHFGRFNAHIRFLALHGLRWGEAVVLEQSDIRDGFVHISRSVHGAPKSAAGVRKVPFLGYFEPFPPNRYGIARALQPHGVNIHSLRHTYAYLLKANGVHVSTAQRLLGHASPVLTLAVYTAVLDDEVAQAGHVLRHLAQAAG